MQSQQTGGWDEIEFPVSLDFQIPSDFVRFNFGSGWLLLTGWDARHTQGLTWQTQGLSCCSTLVLGVSFLGGVTEGWGSKNSGFFQGVNPILRFLSLFTAEGCFLLLAGTGSGILLPFSKEIESLVWFWTYCFCSGQFLSEFCISTNISNLVTIFSLSPCMPAEDG